MLENSNTLNTSLSIGHKVNRWGKPSLFYIDGWANIFYCQNVKDITMNNQQVILCKNMFTFYSRQLLKIVGFFRYVLWYFRDFTRRGILLIRCLRYSPLFCEHINLGYLAKRSLLRSSKNINVCKLLKREYSTTLKGKLDPNWVTGFTDAEGCFSASAPACGSAPDQGG
jgi:hypothetical protein